MRIKIFQDGADLSSKLPLLGKDLTQYSLETVKTFYEAAKASNIKIALSSASAQIGKPLAELSLS